MLLLLAEDEKAMAEAVTAYLSYYQYTVEWVDNGLDALDRVSCGAYDALILDIMMPGMDGISVLRHLREAGNTVPALFLTAKGEVRDKVQGFESGADDYLPKPFAMDELLVRVKAMLRRGETWHPNDLSFADVTLDRGRCAIRAGKKTCSLSRREFQLMELLMRCPHTWFSADALLDRVWGMDAEVEQGTVWVHISWLRKKLESMSAKAIISSKRGLGYALEEKP